MYLVTDGVTEMAEKWDNTRINLDPAPAGSSPASRAIRDNAHSNASSIPRNTLIEISGSRGKLGEILEKMYKGSILSQHEVSAALREYNQIQIRLADLQRLEDRMKIKVDYGETKLTNSLPTDSNKTNAENGGGMSIGTKLQIEKLESKLERKQKAIEELEKKLRQLSDTKVSKFGRDVLVSDLAPPSKIVDNFCDLYAREWSIAFEGLKTSLRDEETALVTLFRIIRHAYIFCYDIAEHQKTAVEGLTDKLQETLLHPSFLHPVSKLKYRATAEVDDETRKHIDVGRRMIADYRNVLVTKSVPGIQELFRKVKLPEISDSGFVTTSVKAFTNKLVELIWLMVVQDPPMMVYWLEPGRTIIKDYFNIFDRKGDTVLTTIWPAVFLKEGGDILSKGVVKTE